MSVLVHSCQQSADDGDVPKKSFGRTYVQRRDSLNSKRRYFTTDPKFESFRPLPLKCVCKKYVSESVAAEFIMQGKALLVYHPKDGELLSEKHIDWTQIFMLTDRSQTPRVDMVTTADMERAYNRLSDPYFYLKAEKLDDAWKEIEKFQDAPYGLIEGVHLLVLEQRAALIVPFRDDPDAMYDKKGNLLPGRILFPFGADQRTEGGHA